MVTAGTIFGPELTQEPVVGGVTASEAKVFVRTDQAANITLRYGSDSNLDTYLLSALATGSFRSVHQNNFAVRIFLQDNRERTAHSHNQENFFVTSLRDFRRRIVKGGKGETQKKFCPDG
jgi:hypothetical protein